MIMKPALPSKNNIVSSRKSRYCLLIPSYYYTKRRAYWRNTTGRIRRLLYTNDSMNMIRHHNEKRHFSIDIMFMQ